MKFDFDSGDNRTKTFFCMELWKHIYDDADKKNKTNYELYNKAVKEIKKTGLCPYRNGCKIYANSANSAYQIKLGI